MKSDQPLSNNKTRAQKEGTPWWKIISYVIGGVALLGIIWFLAVFLFLNSVADDVQHSEGNEEESTQRVENNSAQSSVPDFRKQSEMSQLKTGLDIYKSRNGSYPENLSILKDAKILGSFPNNPSLYRYTTTNEEEGYCLGVCLDKKEANAESSQKCIDQLNLSCDGTPYTVSSE